MKKIHYGIIFLIVALLIVGLVIVFAKQSFTLKVTAFPMAHNLVSGYSEEDELSVSLLINSSTTHLTDFDSITSCSVSDRERENQLPLTLVAINPSQEPVFLRNENFYSFEFRFKVDFSTDLDYQLEIPEAFLTIGSNKTDEDVFMYIGSFCLYKVSSFAHEDFYVSRLRGLVNVVESGKTLVAVEIGIRNASSANLIISRIKPLDGNITVSNADVTETFNYPYQASDSIDSVLGFDYEALGVGDNSALGMEISEGENASFLLPLKYAMEMKTNSFGLMIEYAVSGEEKVAYLNDFTYFTDYAFYLPEINRLIISTYENY